MPQFHTLRSYKHNGGGLPYQQRQAVPGSVVSSVIVEEERRAARPLMGQEMQRSHAAPDRSSPRGALLLPPGAAKTRTTRNLQQTAEHVQPKDPSTTGLEIEHVNRSLQLIDQQRALAQRLPARQQQMDSYSYGSLSQYPQYPQYPQMRTRSLRTIAFAIRSNKAVLIIPGDRRRTRETDELSLGSTHHLSLRLRHLLMLTSAACIFLFCMLTLTPLSQSTQGIFASRMVKTQSAWDIVGPQGAQDSGTVQGPFGTEAYYRSLADADALKYGLSPYYYERQIEQESHFDPNARSIPGAIGIAQFMPTTAQEYDFNPHDPVASLDGGARFMRDLNNMFNGDYRKALAGYNAGPGAVDDAVASCGVAWLSCMDGQPQAYVYIIMGY